MSICSNLFCTERADFTCARCNSMKYCSSTCQKSHWKIHKKNCHKSEIQKKLAYISAERKMCIEGGINHSDIDMAQSCLLSENLNKSIEFSSLKEESIGDFTNLLSPSEYITKFSNLRKKNQYFIKLMEDNISMLARINKEEQERKIKCESMLDKLVKEEKEEKDSPILIEGQKHLEKINNKIDEVNKQILSFAEMKVRSTLFLLDVYKTTPVCCKCGNPDSRENVNQFCKECKMAKYCSRKCQQEDWKEHKKDCKLL